VDQPILPYIRKLVLFKGHPFNEVMNSESYDLADRLGLRSALSPGRNDGLASLLRTLQQQMQTLLHTKLEQPVDACEDETQEKQQQQQPSVAINLLKQQNSNVTAFYLNFARRRTRKFGPISLGRRFPLPVICKIRKYNRLNFLNLLSGTPFRSSTFVGAERSVGKDCYLYPAGADPFMPKPDLLE
jgi:hypothetical protein